jgi:hypothetical protein
MAQQPGGSGLFACQRIQAPTAVEHCLQATFTAPHHHNLIVAKTSELEVYLVDQVRPRAPSFSCFRRTNHCDSQ